MPAAHHDAGGAGGQPADFKRPAAAWLSYGCTIPLFDWPEVVQRSSKLHNFTPNAGSVDTWNAADWWLSG